VASFFVETKGRIELQFEIKGQTYFLTFVEDERRWYVFAPTSKSVERIPVYVDAVQYEGSGSFGKSSYNALG
jgi:hypothetical protein